MTTTPEKPFDLNDTTTKELSISDFNQTITDTCDLAMDGVGNEDNAFNKGWIAAIEFIREVSKENALNYISDHN